MSAAMLSLGAAARLPLLALAATWCAIAIGLGMLLAQDSETDRSGLTTPVTRSSWSSNVSARGVDPCTGESIDVQATLTVEATTTRVLGRASTDAEVRLASASDAPSSVKIEPVSRRFAPYLPIDSSGVYTHVLRATVWKPFHALDLVVELQGRVDDRGEASFLLLGSRIDAPRSPCSVSPSSPPPPPVTTNGGLPVHA
jgi:hypothetical protein